MPIKVSIVEDDDQVRQSLAVLLNGSDGFVCVSAHRSAEEAVMEIPLHLPDVVLTDINLPRQSGVECVRQLKTRMPQLQFLMLTMYEDADLIFNSLTAGASGYLLKRTSPANLLEAIEEVHRGGAPMSSKIARIVVQHFQNQKGPAIATKPVTRTTAVKLETERVAVAEAETATDVVAPAPVATSRSWRSRKKTKAVHPELGLETVTTGPFQQSEPTRRNGVNLDVPTFVRRGLVMN